MDQIDATSCDSMMTSYDRVGMATRRAGAFRLTDVDPTGIRWLWPERIPLGYVTLLVSDPGTGKSLVALDVAARVSTGRPWPDAVGPPSRGGPDPVDANDALGAARLAAPTGSVLLLTIEDHFANTVRPRLDALGADCSRIIGMSHVPGEGVFNMPRPVAINRDINRIEMMLREIPDCRLIILDPITAFFGDTSNRSTGNVWKVLSNLSWLAASANLAVLAVSHFRKKEGAAIHRAMGSLAFIAAARAAWTIAKDPADANKRLLLPFKNNLTPDAKGLAFTIESTEAGCAPVIRWLSDTIDIRADAVLASAHSRGRPVDEREFIRQWLRDYLATGPLPSRAVRKAADANGISAGTLRRAFRELGAVAFQPKNVLHGPWMWKLPDQMRKNRGGEFCATDQITDEFAQVARK